MTSQQIHFNIEMEIKINQNTNTLEQEIIMGTVQFVERSIRRTRINLASMV